ncbi:hypothetical protein B0H10DRAFT_2196740 [Mycena sp. CBHHK59/15]|nr:hypothetical protein B0H10DRAFT_2196740 [Mycena sp. CBHHK59/15]
MPPPTVPALPFALRVKRDTHPGAPVKPRLKWTTEEAQQEKAEKAQRKTEKAEKKAAGIEKAARIEFQKEAEARENDLTGNHPPPASIKKLLRLHAHRLQCRQCVRPQVR